MEGRQNEKKNSNVEAIPYYKLFTFADSIDVMLMFVGTSASIANGFVLPLSSLLIGNTIDSFGETVDTKAMVIQISKVSLKFVYLAIGASIVSFLQVSCWTVTAERQVTRMRNGYLKSILMQDIAFFDKGVRTGEVVGRMSSDIINIHAAMGKKVGKFIQLISTFIGATAHFMMKAAINEQKAYLEADVVVAQTIGSIRTIASLNLEKQAVNKHNKALQKFHKSTVQDGLAAGTAMGLSMFCVYCSFSLAIWFGSKLILDKRYTAGNVMCVIETILNCSFCLVNATPYMSTFAGGRAAAFKMFDTINRKPEINAYDTSGRTMNDICGDIEFRNVYFSYPSRPNDEIFTGLSLTIPSGTTIGLVGESGSGKSTLISLIERFYDPQSGGIFVDGINLKDFQLRWLREKIGLVTQEPVLLALTIKDNIAFGKDNATLEEIRDAIELSNATKFIAEMPQGLDTLVGEHGIQLSGGQKQRIAITRAILKNPLILLLDEATSALDVESERIVHSALDKVMINRTTIIIAHRLSTVRDADMIVVVHHGSIVEKGSHSELKDLNGVYGQLLRLQEAKQDLEQQNTSRQEEILMGSSCRTSHCFSSPQSISPDPSTNAKSSESITTPLLAPFRQPHEVPLRCLTYLNKREILVLILGFGAAITNGLLQLILGILASITIRIFYEEPKELCKDTKFWSLIYVVLALISFTASFAQTYFLTEAGFWLMERIRLLSFEKVVHMEIGWFDDAKNSSGEISARLSTNAATIRGAVKDSFAMILQNSITIVAGLAISFIVSWQFATLTLVFLPLIIISGWGEVKFMGEFSAEAKMMYEEASQVAKDAIENIRTIASLCAEENVMQLFQNKSEGPMKLGMRQGLTHGITHGISFFFMYCVHATSFYIGALLVKDGRTTFPGIFCIFYAFTMTSSGISELLFLASDAPKIKASISSLLAILNRKSEIDSSTDYGVTLEDLKGNIEFQHVSFKYPSRPNIYVVSDFCLSIQAGKMVAVVGESGSGKSTLISLLQRFYDPDFGLITLDGIEIQKFQLRWLRQQMALVSQEPVLFNDTIRTNIAYGVGGEAATDAEIQTAAHLANAHTFISGLQQGYDTVVGERGGQLSGGQKQRIAIARAVLKGSKILLLDEATSALDAESEGVVQEALDRVMADRTRIVVAHRTVSFTLDLFLAEVVT
ncbi:hypothetical protein HHK36_020710 [Tetracentron sinense]|uniref:Uncharacterized protein n=1 Tax=Tetracentron sinense TaxID=13715 RepID=A0A834YVV2_TETSI|nr:hypothetical protein HHK36_020710 [Tetracentron sinense]